MDIQSIKPDLMVHAKGEGAPRERMAGAMRGVHVGTVDHLEGNQWIKLKKGDSKDGKHHWIPVSWVEKADDKAIYLNKNAEEFQRGLMNDPPVSVH